MVVSASSVVMELVTKASVVMMFCRKVEPPYALADEALEAPVEEAGREKGPDSRDTVKDEDGRHNGARVDGAVRRFVDLSHGLGLDGADGFRLDGADGLGLERVDVHDLPGRRVDVHEHGPR